MMLNEKEKFKREKSEIETVNEPELSEKIERVVSGLIEVFIRYIKTIFLIFLRPFNLSVKLSSEMMKDREKTSNPITFLLISTFISSLLLSLSYRIFFESGLEYSEIGYLAMSEITQTIKESTSLSSILLATFPGVVASVLSVLIIRLYLNARNEQVMRYKGIWYITVAFGGMLISFYIFIFVFLLPAFMAYVLVSVLSSAMAGIPPSSLENFIDASVSFFPLALILVFLFYTTVLVAKSYGCTEPKYFVKTFTIKRFRFFLPTLKLICLPAILSFSIVIYLGGISLPSIISHLIAPKEVKISLKEYIVVSVFSHSFHGTKLDVIALVKNTSRYDVAFLVNSIDLDFEPDQYVTHPLNNKGGELISIYGGKDNPIKILRSGETQWLILRAEIPKDACSDKYYGEDAISVYYRVVIKKSKIVDKLFRKKDGYSSYEDYVSIDEIKSKKNHLCSYKRSD